MDPLVDSAMDSSDPFEGTKYRSSSVLGKGGMGTAYVAEHRHLGTRFVCKILRGKHRDDMEHLQGQTLAQEMRVRGELPCMEAIELTRQLLSALSAAVAGSIP